MRVCRTRTFDKAFLRLPDHIQAKAEKAVRLLLNDRTISKKLWSN